MFPAGTLLVTGSDGLLGSAVVKIAKEQGKEVHGLDRKEIDLRDRRRTKIAFCDLRPSTVIHTAAKVGGIMETENRPVEYALENILIDTSVIEGAYKAGVKRLLNVGSSCVYPTSCSQPMKEEYLLSGPWHQTVRSFAAAKLYSMELCSAYTKQYGLEYSTGILCGVFGAGDDFTSDRSHVIGAIMGKCQAALRDGSGEVTLWGTGKARREFLFVDDAAAALLHLAEYHLDGPINVGSGVDITIHDLANLIRSVVGFKGNSGGTTVGQMDLLRNCLM